MQCNVVVVVVFVAIIVVGGGDGKEEEEEEEQTALIKSSNPHLAGGEQKNQALINNFPNPFHCPESPRAGKRTTNLNQINSSQQAGGPWVHGSIPEKDFPLFIAEIMSQDS